MSTPLRISRRKFLGGAGVTLALPLLGAMSPSRAQAPAQPPRRMICINTSLGLHTPNLFPKKDGKDYILLSNSSRGLMKIDAQGIGSQEAIEQKIDDKAGLSYETIEVLKGVVQLDRLGEDTAVALIAGPDGKENLTTIELP